MKDNARSDRRDRAIVKKLIAKHYNIPQQQQQQQQLQTANSSFNQTSIHSKEDSNLLHSIRVTEVLRACDYAVGMNMS